MCTLREFLPIKIGLHWISQKLCSRNFWLYQTPVTTLPIQLCHESFPGFLSLQQALPPLNAHGSDCLYISCNIIFLSLLSYIVRKLELISLTRTNFYKEPNSLTKIISSKEKKTIRGVIYFVNIQCKNLKNIPAHLSNSVYKNRDFPVIYPY